MTDRLAILIVEDDEILAENLATVVEDRGCVAVGPASTVEGALLIIDRSDVRGAILDASLLDRDVTPVAMVLIEKAIPFLIHTGVGLPAELATVFPHVSVVMKPTDPDDVVAQLLRQIDALEDPESSRKAAEANESNPRVDHARDVDKVASALYDQFGSNAVILARRQAAGASGDPRISWPDIIAALLERGAQAH